MTGLGKSGSSKFESDGNPAELPIHLLWALILTSTPRGPGEFQGHGIVLRDVAEGALAWKSLALWIGLRFPIFDKFYRPDSFRPPTNPELFGVWRRRKKALP